LPLRRTISKEEARTIVIPLRRIDIRALTPRLWWDLFMVLVATLNLYLIVFDLTYLWLRPYYFRYLPAVVRLYDPIKGITPHPVTARLVEAAERAERALELGHDDRLAEQLERLRALSVRMVESNPFERSGQEHNLEVVKLVVVDQVLNGEVRPEHLDDEEVARLFTRFWSGDEPQLARRLELFEERLAPLLAVNYTRGFGLDGRPEDHFWKLDLPFLTLFIIEFAVRWILAVRRRKYPRWFLFPIFNWYDLLGLVPTKHLRFFRLFRIGSIYVRLRRSGLSTVGDDYITRAGTYIYDIVAEEISDLVAIRILDEFSDEIRQGTHLGIAARTLAPRRAEIEALLARQVQQAVSNAEMQGKIKGLLELSLDAAVADSEALRSIPLPSAVLRPLVRQVGLIVGDATLETLRNLFRTEEGRQAVQGLVGALVDHLTAPPVQAEVEAFARQFALDLIDEMKRAVAVKKWTLPPPSEIHGRPL
jgi:hypothetical protein